MGALGRVFSEIPGAYVKGGAPFNVFCGNIYVGLQAIGSDQFNAVLAMLRRVQADIAFIQEAGTNTARWTNAGTGMLDEMNYSYVYPDFSSNYKPLICYRKGITLHSSGRITDLWNGDEFVDREPVWAILDIGHATKKILCVCIHMETWCKNSPCTENEDGAYDFARAIQWERVKAFVDSKLVEDPNLAVIVAGDCNGGQGLTESTSFSEAQDYTGFTTQTSPAQTYPVLYSPYPSRQAEAMGLTWLNSTNLDGDWATMWQDDPNPAIQTDVHIDNIFVSDGFRVLGHEILDSEATQTGGVKKYGPPPVFWGFKKD